MVLFLIAGAINSTFTLSSLTLFKSIVNLYEWEGLVVFAKDEREKRTKITAGEKYLLHIP
jgi:hypothetical protein